MTSTVKIMLGATMVVVPLAVATMIHSPVLAGAIVFIALIDEPIVAALLAAYGGYKLKKYIDNKPRAKFYGGIAINYV